MNVREAYCRTARKPLSIVERCGARGGGDRLPEIVEVNGLRHLVDSAALQQLPRFLFVLISADDDDGRRGCGLRLRCSSNV